MAEITAARRQRSGARLRSRTPSEEEARGDHRWPRRDGILRHVVHVRMGPRGSREVAWRPRSITYVRWVATRVAGAVIATPWGQAAPILRFPPTRRPVGAGGCSRGQTSSAAGPGRWHSAGGAAGSPGPPGPGWRGLTGREARERQMDGAERGLLGKKFEKEFEQKSLEPPTSTEPALIAPKSIVVPSLKGGVNEKLLYDL